VCLPIPFSQHAFKSFDFLNTEIKCWIIECCTCWKSPAFFPVFREFVARKDSIILSLEFLLSFLFVCHKIPPYPLQCISVALCFRVLLILALQGKNGSIHKRSLVKSPPTLFISHHILFCFFLPLNSCVNVLEDMLSWRYVEIAVLCTL
jgi:hypothetical protein